MKVQVARACHVHFPYPGNFSGIRRKLLGQFPGRTLDLSGQVKGYRKCQLTQLNPGRDAEVQRVIMDLVSLFYALQECLLNVSYKCQ